MISSDQRIVLIYCDYKSNMKDIKDIFLNNDLIKY